MATDPTTPTLEDTPKETALATPVRERTPVRMGVQPTTLEEAFRLANFVAQSTIVPEDFIGKPANVLIAIEHGLEAGVPWMQAVQGTAVINGRPSFYGDLFLAVLMNSPLYVRHDEYFLVGGVRREIDEGLTADELKRDDTAALCTFWRKGQEAYPKTRRFSMGQARRAGLASKKGPWQDYPERQLQMRARAFAGRDTFPDVLKGIASAEEVRDVPPAEGPAAPAPVQPRRRNEAPAAASSGDVEAAVPSPPSGELGGSSPAAPSVSSAMPPRETRGLLITHTAFVRPKAGEPYYEVEATLNTGGKVTFVTRDEQIYQEAASFEGTDHFVAITWIQAKAAAEQKVVSVLKQITIDETTRAQPNAPPADADLFRN